jgi:hypothetical protein
MLFPFDMLTNSTCQPNATRYNISLCCRYIQSDSSTRIAVMALMVFSIPLFLPDFLLVQGQNVTSNTIGDSPFSSDQQATNNTNSSITYDISR